MCAMKFRLLIRIIVIVSVVLVCTGFGVYSFLWLDTVERQKDFDLHTLVPQDAIAVLQTDRMAELVQDVNGLQCSEEGHFLYVSDLFTYLKKYLQTFVDDTPHGLSAQMNRMLISFHEPDNKLNQVLYCSLGAGDSKLVEAFIQKYTSSHFPAKQTDYRGRSISIYPMSGGRFLAAYFTSDYLVVSFQKRLIEQVIDAVADKSSLMELPSFRSMHLGKRANVSVTLYVRMKSIDMGGDADTVRTAAQLGGWGEFDLKLKDDAVYCSGLSHGADSTLTFVNALRKQRPIELFPGQLLPGTTFFYDFWSVSDGQEVWNFVQSQQYAGSGYSDYIKARDEEWIGFLNEYGGGRILSCLFHPKDTVDTRPCAVMRVPIVDVLHAERKLQSLLYATPREKDAPPFQWSSPQYKLYPQARPYRQYVLPRNTLLARLAGIAGSALHTYACFYKGSLLLAPDARSLSAYICAMEENDLLEGIPLYEASVEGLAPVYNFLMMADMEEIMSQEETSVRLVPNFFFRHSDFFRHFILSIQFTCTDGVVYPNVVLLYKGG